METIIITCILVLAINGITASKFETIANEKGYSGYFAWCFLFGIAGWAMVIALPDRKQPTMNRNDSTVTVYTDERLPEL